LANAYDIYISPHVFRLSGKVTKRRANEMLYTVAVILIVLWILGFLAFHIGGGLIHILLVVAVIAIVYQLVTGRRAL
jgi:hypothetical protein